MSSNTETLRWWYSTIVIVLVFALLVSWSLPNSDNEQSIPIFSIRLFSKYQTIVLEDEKRWACTVLYRWGLLSSKSMEEMKIAIPHPSDSPK